MRKIAQAVFLVATAAYAQHPITFDDLAAIHRVGAPQISPDGRTVAYDASTPDLAANKSHSAIFTVPATGGQSTKIADGSNPAWSPDGKAIAYVKDDQVYLMSGAPALAGGPAEAGAPSSRKITDLLGGAATVKWMPDGSGLLVVSDIYPDCGVDPACIK